MNLGADYDDWELGIIPSPSAASKAHYNPPTLSPINRYYSY